MKKIESQQIDNDIELVELVKKGNQQALAVLYEKYFEPIYRFCYWQTNRSLDAEDLTQDILVAMMGSLHTFTGKSSFRNWLYVLAKRRIIAWLRVKYRLPVVAYDEFIQGIGDSDEWLSEDNQELKRQSIGKMLQVLSDRDRQVVALHYLHGYSQVEVAKKLRITISNVKVICHRSLKVLSKYFKK